MTPVELLAQAEALLLDFDGPVCSVFSGIPAAIVADQLRAILPTAPSPLIAQSADPFKVLAHARELGNETAYQVHNALAAHEVEAVANATPTPGGHQLIRQWHAIGRPLAIVSNNSATAISAYLNLHNLTGKVKYISARTVTTLHLLKPSPHLLIVAADTLNTPMNRCVMLGDSLSDIQAARAAGAWSVSYANKVAKRTIHSHIRPDAIVTDLAKIDI